ncbi:acyl-CoA dehydrogenase [Novosphingobium sp.]|uniref:acyl-CoA dehydrogenase n=1 Tax=Novosphingobium sp. TaxID=1874826 RepID=UPI002628CA2C|nr:acyl-CoA dehydrogenase [Novosphingobium sp.]
MQLSLPEDSVPVKDMFERFFADEATSARVRAAEPVGFDAELWKELLALEVPFMRMPADAGGGEMSLFDACLMMEQAGRRLAPAPLAETLVALRILGLQGSFAAREWIGKVREKGAVLALALRSVADGKPQLVPGGAVAAAILTFDGKDLAIEIPSEPLPAPVTLGGAALGLFTPGKSTRILLTGNADAEQIWSAGIEEWKLLTSAALIGLSREALEMAAAYACEREAFGQPIGTYQGIAHPLANDVIDADGAALLQMWTLRAIADRAADAGGLISTLFWWASRTATNSVAHAIHTFAGYGLSNEYDIQLYHRRAKAWALALGDPEAELERGGRRLFMGEETRLPATGPVEVDFESPDVGNPLAEELRELLSSILDPDKHALFEENFEAHDWDVHRALGRAGFLFPDWPAKWGGRDADADSTRACRRIQSELGWAGLAGGVTGMAGVLVQQAGVPELQEEVLLGFARGEFTSCLGFTEPSGGSDVFAAKTRAVRDGDEWVINGQKMFTSGADLANYVLLLTRTDPDVPKHKGLTLFLVPLNVPGVEIQPIHTFMDERTNATFYSDVRIPDRYRLGPINGGVRMMATALSMEQGGSHYYHQMRKMVDAVADWARNEERDGKPLIAHPDTLSRLAKVHTHAAISEALAARCLWTRIAGEQDLAFGPASKVFTTEAFIVDSADLLNLSAPASLVRGKEGLGQVEMGYRHSTASSVYGGTSEVLRSMVAERRLGLPRSRA